MSKITAVVTIGSLSNNLDTRMRQLANISSQVKTAVHWSKKSLVQRMTKSMWMTAKNFAPVGVRPKSISLKGSIKMKTRLTKKHPYGEVYITTANRNHIIAAANELGVQKRNYYIGPNTSMLALRRWAEVKNQSAFIKGKITVGGRRTRLGKDNVFWSKAFKKVGDENLRQHLKASLEKELRKVTLQKTGG